MNAVTAFHLIAQEAPIFLSIVTLLFIIGICVSRLLLWSSVIMFFSLLFLFRNPIRVCSSVQRDPCTIVAPADGKILDISLIEGEPEGYRYKVSFVTSFLDVYMNRLPYAGVFTHVKYTPSCRETSCREYMDINVCAPPRRSYKMRQIGGYYTRSVVCWPTEGDALGTGQTYGMILFGSYFELFLPKTVRFAVGAGQHVLAGTTVIAHWTQ